MIHSMRLRLHLMLAATLAACSSSPARSPGPAVPPDAGSSRAPASTPGVTYAPRDFVMGVDLSYVNQILDHGGIYHDAGRSGDPYRLLADRGANLVRLRLWHSPDWVRDSIYGPDATLYSGLDDVTEAIRRARAAGMQTNLDIHYSDIWADPGRQHVPAAWRHIRDLETLADSVYGYTRSVLQHLRAHGLTPEYVQVGNETNCGMLATGAPDGFPNVRTCDDNWEAQGTVLNAGIRAVREVAPDARIILHVAQPENVAPFFRGITGAGGVTDFDVIGFSFYELWSDVDMDRIDEYIAAWRDEWRGRDVMIVETAYPFTLENADAYTNILGERALDPEYPTSPEGQRDYMIALTEEVIRGGGSGVMYWEPAWITSRMRDLWGTGSSWENNAFFDFEGNVHAGVEWMTHDYEGLRERAADRRVDGDAE